MNVSRLAELHFVRQQGYTEAQLSSSPVLYRALMFQPRVVGLVVVAGIMFQAWPVFLALSALLWWNSVAPRWNVFDAVYNAAVASPRGLPPLSSAPVPRRFAQGMAGTFALGIGLSLLWGNMALAWVLEGFFLFAMVSLLLGRFCLGSYVYHVLTGNRRFAGQTLPWAREEAR